MQNYNSLIYEKIKGNSPEEKYNNLMAMMKLLQQIAFPRRGTVEEEWNIMDVVERATPMVEQHERYE